MVKRLKISNNSNYFIIIVLLIIVILLLSLHVYHLNIHKNEVQVSSFMLLNPSIATYESEEFEEIQDRYFENFIFLKQRLEQYVDNVEDGNVSVYVEHLNTGAWTGINEREKYEWGSLNKLPIAICVMKLVENTNLSLNSNILIKSEDLDESFGNLYSYGLGNEYSVKQLLNYSLIKSDNTANNALKRICPIESFTSSFYGSGITSLEIREGNPEFVSAKMYSSFFRTLYNSGYLRRTNSNYLLSLMANSEFNEGILAGVSENVVISHKVAIRNSIKQYHDCGIVYYENEPYILCVMTENLSKSYSNQVISRVSKVVYDYFDEKSKNE